MISAQELVEKALALVTVDEAMVIRDIVVAM